MEKFPVEDFIKNTKPQLRLLKDLRGVLRNSEKEGPDSAVAYAMYRDLCLEKDRDMIKRHELRFDITVIHPEVLTNELAKTYGHYHKNNMMEISEVLYGKAWFILQRYDEDPAKIKEAYIVYVNEGEKIIYPPGFGHITINPQKDRELITSNWISVKTESDYEPYRELQGACYYFFKNEKGEFSVEENKKYKDSPALIRLTPNEIPELKISFDKTLYSLIETPGKLDFLNRPEHYKDLLTIKRCFTAI